MQNVERGVCNNPHKKIVKTVEIKYLSLMNLEEY